MKIVIINNFGMFPISPPYSTSSVYSLLNKNGVDASHIDVNLYIWKKLLDKNNISTCRLNNENLTESNPFCPPITEKKHTVIKDNVVKNIDEAKDILHNPEKFKKIDSLNWAIGIIFQAQQLYYYQYGTFIHNKFVYWPEVGFNTHNIDKVYELSQDKNRNPFIQIYEEIVTQLINEKPDLIGVDIQFPWEIVQTLTLNIILKKHLPDCHINYIGYGFDEVCFSRIIEDMKINSRLRLGFDSLFLIRNDTELLKMYSKEQVSDLSDIGSLTYEHKGKSYFNGPHNEPSIDFSIIPDYSSLPLEDYFSPEIVFNDKLSSKCFWNKCTFCNINRFKQERTEIDLSIFVRRIEKYIELYNCKNLFLLDEAATPAQMNELSDMLMNKNLQITWTIRTRVDNGYTDSLLRKMYQSGCREMWLGLETVAPEVLKAMNKSDNIENYIKAFKNIMNSCKEIGIGIHVCLILGFPTEKEADRLILKSFFKDNQKEVERIPFFVTYNMFNLNTSTYIYDHPEKFNIEKKLFVAGEYNMIDIPFIRGDTQKLQSELEPEIDDYCNEITNILVANNTYKLLWFTVADSPWELLMQKYYKDNNPFQTAPSKLEHILIKLYPFAEKVPFILNILNRITSNNIQTTESQIYH